MVSRARTRAHVGDCQAARRRNRKPGMSAIAYDSARCRCRCCCGDRTQIDLRGIGKSIAAEHVDGGMMPLDLCLGAEATEMLAQHRPIACLDAYLRAGHDPPCAGVGNAGFNARFY
jgi:hypothetical protein